MNKLTMFVLAVVLLIPVPAAALWLGWKPRWDIPATVSSQGKTQFTEGPPLVSVQKLSELVTLRVRQRTTLTGQNNWYKGIWEIEGDALFGCDCGQAKWSAIDQEHKTLTLRLPEPRLMMARVDHERTRLYDFRCITWNPACLFQGDPDAIKEEAMKHAQEKLGNTANTEENLSVARQQAEYKLKDFYTVLGWSLTVEWR